MKTWILGTWKLGFEAFIFKLNFKFNYGLCLSISDHECLTLYWKFGFDLIIHEL